MDAQAAHEEEMAKRQAAARRRAAQRRVSHLEAAQGEVERLQREKKHDREDFVARAFSTDPEAHVMRNGEGGTVPSYNVQLVTDNGFVVNVEAATDAIYYRQLQPAIRRCEATLGCRPQQVVADGDYTNHASVQAAAACGVDFYGSWQESWRQASATRKDVVARFKQLPSPTTRSTIAPPPGTPAMPTRPSARGTSPSPGMPPALPARSAPRRWTTSTLPVPSPSPPAPDSVPHNVTPPTNAPHPADRSSTGPATYARSIGAPRSSTTHTGRT